MKTIKQLLSNYLHERRDLITGERVVFAVIMIAVAIVACAAFIVFGSDITNINPWVFVWFGVLGYLTWILFFRKVK